MPVTHVALLRGINVGHAKRVAMADLRALVEGLGYADARTLLNSGNVVFTARGTAGASAGARIERALVKELGVPARTIVLTARELAVAVEANPLLAVADNPSRLLVAFLADAADRGQLRPLEKGKWGREAIALGTRVAYLWCADGILTSPVATAVGRALGDGVTSRNWATVLKLHQLASQERRSE